MIKGTKGHSPTSNVGMWESITTLAYIEAMDAFNILRARY